MESEAAMKSCLERGNSSCSDEEMTAADLRRGPWTVDEDLALINYIAVHGDGRWNSLARCAGLKRTGKSCRLRWLNYLRPDVRRGNITLEEQLLILELHSRWGNRWSKIAQFLPGRTDNEIKNYWRTRVQKHAKQLKCDVNSKKFKDAMRYLWMPRLVERIQAASATTNAVSPTSSSTAAAAPPAAYNNLQLRPEMYQPTPILESLNHGNNNNVVTADESSINTASSDSLGAHVSTTSEFTAGNNNYGYQVEIDNSNNNWSQMGDYVADTLTSPCGNYFDQGLNGWPPVDQWTTTSYCGGAMDTSELSWNAEDIFVFQQQFGNGGGSFNI
ncbi:hypothetical protein V2J09_001877 [Rumex salicifolius]